MLMFDFKDGLGLVPAHRHKNPDGTEGGWVAETASVESTCLVGGEVGVFGDVEVIKGTYQGDEWIQEVPT